MIISLKKTSQIWSYKLNANHEYIDLTLLKQILYIYLDKPYLK